MPADAYYGVQTARAVENFPISGLRAPADLVTATILVKKAAAEANAALGRLDPTIARRHRRGRRRDSGRPLPRSVRRRRVPGGRRHVAQHERERSAGQPGRRRFSASRGASTRASTRTITSTWASRRTTSSRRRRDWRCCSARRRSSRPRAQLAESLDRKGDEFSDVLKTGPDASAGRRADDARSGVQRLRRVHRARRRRRGAGRASSCAELNIGATAVGTGLNAGEDFRQLGRREPRAHTPGLR